MISICMPFWLRQGDLDRTLAGYRQHYPDVEVVVADDGSDPPAEGDCRIVRLPRKDCALNPCVPINAAVRASTGDVIVLTSPEVEHRTPILGEMLRRLEPMIYVSAACLDIDTGVWLAKSGVRNGVLPVPDGASFHFCAMLHRETFDRAGGFDEAYREGQGCEDTDFLWRLHSRGVRFVQCDDQVVYHRRSHTEWPAGGLEWNRRLFRARWGTVA